MLCYATLCYAMLRYATLCYAILTQAGFGKWRAIRAQLGTALAALLGAVVALVTGESQARHVTRTVSHDASSAAWRGIAQWHSVVA